MCGFLQLTRTASDWLATWLCREIAAISIFLHQCAMLALLSGNIVTCSNLTAQQCAIFATYRTSSGEGETAFTTHLQLSFPMSSMPITHVNILILRDATIY